MNLYLSYLHIIALDTPAFIYGSNLLEIDTYTSFNQYLLWNHCCLVISDNFQKNVTLSEELKP